MGLLGPPPHQGRGPFRSGFAGPRAAVGLGPPLYRPHRGPIIRAGPSSLGTTGALPLRSRGLRRKNTTGPPAAPGTPTQTPGFCHPSTAVPPGSPRPWDDRGGIRAPRGDAVGTRPGSLTTVQGYGHLHSRHPDARSPSESRGWQQVHHGDPGGLNSGMFPVRGSPGCVCLGPRMDTSGRGAGAPATQPHGARRPPLIWLRSRGRPSPGPSD